MANTLELVLVHVDMDTRKAVPMPEDVADGFDREIETGAALAWVAPVCGVMGVRRRE